MKKNDILNVDIIDSGMNFEGIAKVDNKVIFVPNAIKGENVDIIVIKDTKDYAIGKILKINTKSKYRVKPFCDVFATCGGCSAQHISYNYQLELKKNMIENVLKKQNVDYLKLNDTIGMGMSIYYRNKVQYPVREEKGNTYVGFYLKRSHNIVENTCCYIQNRTLDLIAKDTANELIKVGFKGYREDTFKGDIRHVLVRRGYHTQELLLCVVVNNLEVANSEKLKEVVIDIAKKNKNIKSVYVNVNSSKTNEILGKRDILVFGSRYIKDKIGNLTYYISLKSFFQVNTIQAEVLYETLKQGLKLNKEDILFDLYSGVGSIGIYLSDEVQEVYGIEIEKDAVEMANLNLKENLVHNANYIAGSVEDKIVEFKNSNIKPSVIVVDPPRKGLDEKSINYILEFDPKKIGYVSCNPATMARDLKMLSKNYEIVEITPVDMFPHASAVECVAILNRREI